MAETLTKQNRLWPLTPGRAVEGVPPAYLLLLNAGRTPVIHTGLILPTTHALSHGQLGKAPHSLPLPAELIGLIQKYPIDFSL